MKRLFGANALVLILSMVSTAIGGAFVLFSFGEGSEDLSIYSAIQQAMRTRDDMSVVNRRMATIKKSVVNELRRGKVLEGAKGNQFVLTKPEAGGVSDYPKMPSASESRIDFIKKRLKKYNSKNTPSLSVMLNNIKKASSPYEREKRVLSLLENRFIFVWRVSDLIDDVYNQIADLEFVNSGAALVTVKKVTEGQNGKKVYDLQLWMDDGTTITRSDKVISVEGYPIREEATAKAGRLTKHSLIHSSFVATDLEVAKRIGQEDGELVEALVSGDVKPDGSASTLVGGYTITTQSESVGTVTSSPEENCIVPAPDGDGCTVYGDDNGPKIDRTDPRHERRFPGSDFEFVV